MESKKVYVKSFVGKELNPDFGYYVDKYYCTEDQYLQLLENYAGNCSLVSHFENSGYNTVNVIIK